MRRREVIALLGGLPVLSGSVAAQTTERMRRVGVLTGFSAGDPDFERWLTKFIDALRERDWASGDTILVETRAAGGDLGRLRAQAAELVGLKPAVLLAQATPAARALREQTGSIPIVFVHVADPLGAGFVESIPRPGGNITGVTNFEPTMGGKWLELLTEIAPRVKRVGMLFSPETAASGSTGGIYLRSLEGAAQTRGVRLIVTPVHEAADIDGTIASLADGPDTGMIVMPNTFTLVHRHRIAAAAAERGLPAIYPYRAFAAAGGLMSYGADLEDAFRRAASYVDRILKGVNPGELPVEAPTKFELVLNLKVARALGLTPPQRLLVAADEVIE
jgi:putative ABC transport system substrate-binding protein